MANLNNVESLDGVLIVNNTAKVNYNAIDGIPSSLIDPNNHNHDDRYKSKDSIEDEFTTIMNKVAAMTKALTIRPLKTKGFLNGGYKSSYVYARRVQRFNTVTETGVEIGAIGTVTSQYTPGGSAELCGYYFGDTTASTVNSDHSKTGRYVDKLVYLTEVETYLGMITHHQTRSTLYNVYSQSKLYLCDAGSSWSELDVISDTCSLITTSQAGRGIGRQGLSSEIFGMVTNSGDTTSTKFTYLTGISSAGSSQAISQQGAGLTKDADIGYWISLGTANNFRVNMVNSTSAQLYCFTQGFGESNALGSEKVGFMMGGYDGVQHGYVQKMVWATEAASNVLGGSLAIPQSSAGMAEA